MFFGKGSHHDTPRTFWDRGSDRQSRQVRLGLTIVFVLTVIASQSAQAQTFQKIHDFTFDGPDGTAPYAGLTIRGGSLYGTAVGGGTLGVTAAAPAAARSTS